MALGSKVYIGKKLFLSQFQETNQPVRLKQIVNTHADMLTLTDLVDGDIIIVKDDSDYITDHKQYSYIYFNSVFEPFIEVSLDAIENIVFVTNYSALMNLTSTIEQMAYVKEDETINSLEYKKGLYYYDLTQWIKIDNNVSINDTLDKDSDANDKVSNTYSVNKILTLLDEKENKIYKQNSEPINPIEGDIWIDIDKKTISIYNSSSWDSIGGNNSAINLRSLPYFGI